MEHIVIGTITCPLTVAEDLFNEGVLEELFNKIAAFLIVRIGRKERGNFYLAIMEELTGVQEFVLFFVLMEIFNIPIKVTVTAT